MKSAHTFIPLSSVYQPIGQLYRPIAATRCAICGEHKEAHN